MSPSIRSKKTNLHLSTHDITARISFQGNFPINNQDSILDGPGLINGRALASAPGDGSRPQAQKPPLLKAFSDIVESWRTR